MKNLSINFWKKCNNHCIFCFCREKDFLTEEVSAPAITSLAQVKKALLQHRASCDRIIVSGNEPLLNPDLFLVILLAKKMGFEAEIRTNGRLLKDKKICLKLLAAGLDSIGITLLSHDEKTHNFLTQRADSFKETVRGIKNLLALAGPHKITIYNVINKFNYRELARALVFYYSLGARNAQLNFVYHNCQEIVPSFSELKKPLHLALATGEKLGMSVGTYGIPLCFLGKYQKLATERKLKNEIILGGRISDYNYLRTEVGKRESKYCKKCFQKNICEGTWKSYYNVYGEEEFKNKAF